MTMARTLPRLPLLVLAPTLLAATGPVQAQDVPARVIHSPWLALRIEQDGAEVPLRHVALLRTEARLRRAPFTLTLPVRGADDDYRLAAWSDASILLAATAETGSAHDGREDDETPFFSPYRCMADTAAGSGTLMLNKEGHHCLSGISLGPDRDLHRFHVSQVLGPGGTLQIEDHAGPLFLLAWFDEDANGVPEHGEYELLVLQFEPAGR